MLYEILVKPVITPFMFPSNVEYGNVVQVSCIFSAGDEPFRLQWFKNNHPLLSSPDLVISQLSPRVGTLLITRADSVHRGRYECRVANPVGSSSVSGELNVKGSWILGPRVLPVPSGSPITYRSDR